MRAFQHHRQYKLHTPYLSNAISQNNSISNATEINNSQFCSSVKTDLKQNKDINNIKNKHNQTHQRVTLQRNSTGYHNNNYKLQNETEVRYKSDKNVKQKRHNIKCNDIYTNVTQTDSYNTIVTPTILKTKIGDNYESSNNNNESSNNDNELLNNNNESLNNDNELLNNDNINKTDAITDDIQLQHHNELVQLAKQLSLERVWYILFGYTWDNVTTISEPIKTIADFWTYFNAYGNLQDLPEKCDLYLFRDNIKPQWENDENKFGGKWIINLEQLYQHDDDSSIRNDNKLYIINEVWLRVVLGLIGEQYYLGCELINGVSLNVRHNGMRCSIWTTNIDPKEQQQLGTSIRTIAEIQNNVEIEFKSHRDAMQNKSCFASTVLLSA